jgi:hypothetical protein
MSEATQAFEAMMPLPEWMKRIPTTNPNKEGKISGVQYLKAHFDTFQTITEEYANDEYGIGRLSARVYDLNMYYRANGIPKKIECVEKDVIKRNGSKARVADYYKVIHL